MKTFEYNGAKYTLGQVTAKERQDAKALYRRTFFKALEDGAFLQSATYEKAIEWGVWSDSKNQEFEALHLELDAVVKKLEEGGYDFNEAVEDAKRAGEIRNEILKTNMDISSVVGHSAERYAEDAEADYLLWASILQGKKKAFKTFDEFLEAKENDDPIIVLAITNSIGISADYYRELPENKFLIEFGVMNENLEFLDEDGNPIVEQVEVEKPERKPFVNAPEKKTEPEAVEAEPEEKPASEDKVE